MKGAPTPPAAPGEGRPRAFSYLRFSTPEQASGDSRRRQEDAARAYAAEHGFELDETLTFRDLGISAFHGGNARKGSLAHFRFAVQKGDVPPGSFLLVESFDRLSRMDPWDAQQISKEIIDAGVTIVTLIDKKVWSRESIRGNPLRILESLFVMIRAHEESATKSRRLRDVFEHKRKQAAARATSEPFTRVLPAWITYNESAKAHELIPERAAIVAAIFAKSAEGWGYHKIAQWLNAKKEPTCGSSAWWHRTYILKILKHSAAVGTFTPHRVMRDDTGRRRREPQAAIEGYFPAAVDRDVYDTVALKMATTHARGRHTNAQTRSIFAGVMRCGRCGGTVFRVPKGTYVYLVCATANSSVGKCLYRAVPYQETERDFCERIAGIINEAPRGKNTEELEEEIAKLAEGVYAVEGDVEGLAEHLVGEGDSRAIRKKMRELEAWLDKERIKLAEKTADRDRRTDKRVQRRLDALLQALTAAPLDVVKANAAMREAVRRIVLDLDKSELRIHWHHVAEDEPQVLTWITRHHRWDVQEGEER